MCDDDGYIDPHEYETWSLRLALATVTPVAMTVSDVEDDAPPTPLGEVLDDIKARGGDPWLVMICAARDLARALAELYDGPPEEWASRIGASDERARNRLRRRPVARLASATLANPTI